MVYIKLEEDMDKFLEKYSNFPKNMKRIIFKSKCRNGKFIIKKEQNNDIILLPTINDRILKNLQILIKVKCFKCFALSENLQKNMKFADFVKENNLKVMDGKWLFKNMLNNIMYFIMKVEKKEIQEQEIAILCNKLNETLYNQIEELASKVKILNVLTRDMKQFQKIDEKLNRNKGIIINISSNYQKSLLKSNIIINVDFNTRQLQKCKFAKNVNIIDMSNEKISDFNGRMISDFEIELPEKYRKYNKILTGFENKIIYESIIYKNTSYNNIKNEIKNDNIKIMYLRDFKNKIIKNPNFNSLKSLDKITI